MDVKVRINAKFRQPRKQQSKTTQAPKDDQTSPNEADEKDKGGDYKEAFNFGTGSVYDKKNKIQRTI